jgi:hypothetical protein
MDAETAHAFVQKIREFAQTELDAEERALLGQLLSPGIAQAYAEDDVVGFMIGGPEPRRWSPAPLPGPLAEAVRDHGLRVESADEEPSG